MSFRSLGLGAILGLLAIQAAACAGDSQSDLGVVGSSTSALVEAVVPTTSSEYKLPAAIDPEVLDGRQTELWARVYRPATLTAGTRYPVLVFLHGNHATCGRGSNPRIDDSIQYSSTGTCPTGYVVVPSHEGYAYVANELAGQGYIVVSINANRGINASGGVAGDSGLNLARGRLVLKHLATLSEWNRGVAPTPSSLGVDLTNHLDFSHVGLMGHSRGGEGVRAAYAQYFDPGSSWVGRIVSPMTFDGIFEIGPVDGQTSRILDAANVRWTVLLPMCDGDVSNLQGVRVFDRAMGVTQETKPTFKGTLTAWGTNHNYYNSEWQQSDSSGCTGHTPLFTSGTGITGSEPQRNVGRISMSNFFRGSVGPAATPALLGMFDPVNALPTELASITRVDRGYTPTPDSSVSLRLEEFTGPTGTSSAGFPNIASNVTVVHQILPEHASQHQGARISWTAAGAETYFQTNVAAAGAGISLANHTFLDLRLDRASDPLNPATSTNFNVQLVDANGNLSVKVPIRDYLDLPGPVGGPFSLHSMLQTARIPLTRFAPMALGAIRGVRLTFDATASGAIYVANIRAVKGEAAPPQCPATPKLDLKIRQVAKSNNSVQYRFQVYNRDSAPIKLSDLSVRLWMSDTATNVVTDVYYGGHVLDGAGGYRFGSVNTTPSTKKITPACAPTADRVADWQVSLTGNDAREVPGGGGRWVDAIINVRRNDWGSFVSYNDDFSRTPAYQGTTISDAVYPTVYGDDARFVLYYQGKPVSEFVSATTADPAGGSEPSCLSSCGAAGAAGSTVAVSSAARVASTTTRALAAPVSASPLASAAAVMGRVAAVTTNATGDVQVEVVADAPFGVRDELLVLSVGDHSFNLSSFPDPSDTRRAVFTLTPQEFAAIAGTGPASAGYAAPAGVVAQLGTIPAAVVSK